MNNNDTKNKKVGRPDVLDLEQYSPKERVERMFDFERARSVSELVKAAAADEAIDLTQKYLLKFVPAPLYVGVKAAVEVAEMQFEHATEQAQGIEHNENMVYMLDNTLTMFRQLLESERPDLDKRAIKESIRKLELLDAVYSGDATKVAALQKMWPIATKALNFVLDKSYRYIWTNAKKAALEFLDWLPFACPESLMEIQRMSTLHTLAKIYNSHPDVTEKLRVFEKATFVHGLQLQKLRAMVMFQNFDIAAATEAYAAQYAKTAAKERAK